LEKLAFLKGRKKTPPNPPDADSTQNNQNDIDDSSIIEDDFGDRRRVKARYKAAATLLRESIESCQSNWESFDFQELSDEPEDFNDAQFRNKINLALASKEDSIKDRTASSKCRYTVECIFTALSPFAKNFLTIAKEGQAVMRFSVFLICDLDSCA